MRDKRILLTGATGIVGCEIVRELLRSAQPPTIVALLRGSDDEATAAVLQHLGPYVIDVARTVFCWRALLQNGQPDELAGTQEWELAQESAR